jgi:tetratricopeptide (TPR) repeat protein
MKKLFWLVMALVGAVSCSPEIYTCYLDVRTPSDSGLDLSRKSMAMVYMDGDVPADSAFNRSMASALARALEEDYFGGEEVIGLYRIPKADSLSLDMMHSLVMDTGEDVIFLITSSLGEAALETNQTIQNAHSVDSAYVCPAQVPLNTAVYIYDSMGEDVVRRFNGSTVLRPLVYNNGMIPQENLKDQARLAAAGGEAERMGERVSRRFKSNWNTQSFSFYYYDNDSSERWVNGIVSTLDGKYAAAVDAWAPFLKEDNDQLRACACYNMALVFYMMDNLDLATRWLDAAETIYPDLVLINGLRTRIVSRTEKAGK